MQQPLHIMLPTDAFPPGSVGGSAWSSQALSQALAQRGHRVTVVVPRQRQRGLRRRAEGAIEVVEVGYRAPRVPIVQNYFRFERLWAQLARQLARLAGEQEEGAPRLPIVLHGQHAQTIPAAVWAGKLLDAPAIGTVRDYWPLHYFATGLLGDRVPVERFGTLATAVDLLIRMGLLRGLPGLAALPYVIRHVRRRARLLAEADATIAASRYVAWRLREVVPAEKLHVIHHAVDTQQLDRTVAAAPATRVAGPYVLYAGKLERNKGADLLPTIVEQAARSGARGWTLVVAGQGSLRRELERELSGVGVELRFLDWADHDEVLRLTAHCSALLFPSGWAEPLSRVLVEAAALGAPIAAMASGGTPDILEDGVSGLLAATAEGLGQALGHLLLHPEQAEAFGRQARRRAEQRFAAPIVAAQHEELYRQLLNR